MLEFKNISKSFKSDFWVKPTKVLNNLTFTVPKGTICGFLGANGAGKTTSLKILFDFIKADSGEISFSSELGENFKEIKSKIGYFPEHPYFYKHLTGFQFVTYIGSLQGLENKIILKNTLRWSRELLIEHALNKKIKTYSKGMLQRLGFLISILHNPKLIILDEPLSGLDPNGRKVFKNILKMLNYEGTTIFFSSHIVSDVEEICDHLVVIDKGELVYNGEIEKLLESNRDSSFNIKVANTTNNCNNDFLNNWIINKNRYQVELKIPEKSLGLFLDYISKEEKGNLISINPEQVKLEDIIYKKAD